MKTKYRSFTNILYARPSFYKGVSRLANVLGNSRSTYNSSNSDYESDVKALYSDWKTVGNDMKEAMDNVK